MSDINIPSKQTAFLEEMDEGFVKINIEKGACINEGASTETDKNSSDWQNVIDKGIIKAGLHEIASGASSLKINEQCFRKLYKSSDISKGPTADPGLDCSYIRHKLRVYTEQFKDLKMRQEIVCEKNLDISELYATTVPLVEVVEQALLMLERLEFVEDELYAIEQLLGLQKSRNGELQEQNIRLEMTLKDVNKDYGQLLVECDAKEKLSVKGIGKAKLQMVNECVQTEQVMMVDAETCILSNTCICCGAETEQDDDDQNVASPKPENSANNNNSEAEAGAEAEGSTSNEVLYIASTEPTTVTVHESITENNTTDRLGSSLSLEGMRGRGVTDCCEGATGVSNGGPTEISNNENQTKDKTTVEESSPTPKPDITGQQSPSEQPRSNDASVPSIPWACDHYKRHCLVKFDCCDEYYPCHRCHNKDLRCDVKDLKSKDAILLKCLACNQIQTFTELSQNCGNCGLKFADYFCHPCQHLTGTDNSPYHCDKCGICRVKGDQSFHCDTCGVCLDNQLLGNHVCRHDSAHDPCCICFEDAFSGCQILPCSHKVHKDCARLMINNGVRCCPVCRQSFAHVLQQRP